MVEAYKKSVGFVHGAAGAENAIVALFLDGHSKESLEMASRNYGQWCTREGKETRYRYGATKFFGEGGFVDFLAGVPPSTPDQKNGLTVAQRREAEKAYLAKAERRYPTAAEIHEKQMREVK